MNKFSIYDCNVLFLNEIHNKFGDVAVVEEKRSIPFSIKRIYYLYDVPSGESRGGHYHKRLYQLIVAASGSFDVLLDDGVNKKIVTLNHPNYGLMVVPGVWRKISKFSSGSVCMVLASDKYDESDYVRD